MGSPGSYAGSLVQSNYTIPDSRSKVVKKKKKNQQRKSQSKTSQPRLKRGNGLLRTDILVRSDAMQIAKSNSLNSALLRLPGEIRNKIWKYATGNHQINIYNKSRGVRLYDVQLACNARPEDFQSGSLIPRVFVKPVFTLPSVCRQMYVETSAMVYTLNTFTFTDRYTLDRFIRDRAPGQRHLVTSIDVPFEYFRMYSDDSRKKFRQTFRNIKRVGIHVQVALSTQRVIPETWNTIKPLKEPLADTKKRLEEWVKEKEGTDLEVNWYGSTSASFVYLHY